MTRCTLRYTCMIMCTHMCLLYMSICTATHISAHGGCHLLTHAAKYMVRSYRRRSVRYARRSLYALCTDSCINIFRSGRVCSVWKRSSCCALAVIYGGGVPTIGEQLRVGVQASMHSDQQHQDVCLTSGTGYCIALIMTLH